MEEFEWKNRPEYQATEQTPGDGLKITQKTLVGQKPLRPPQ